MIIKIASSVVVISLIHLLRVRGSLMADADDQGGGGVDPRLDAFCQYTLRTLKVCVCVCAHLCVC